MTLIDDRAEVDAGAVGDLWSAPVASEPWALDPFHPPTGFTPMAEILPRSRVAVSGTVTSCVVARWAGGSTLEVTVEDPTGSVVLAFLGRKGVGGIHTGSRLMAAGRVVLHQNRPALMNPYFWLVADTAAV